jgi:ketosteroid isomerase-like protein
MISRERAREVDSAVAQWIAQGGAVAMLTLTMPHVEADSLEQLLAWLGDALQRTKRGNPWKRIAARHGVHGAMTTKEATWGREAGWHPHFHIVLLVSGNTEAEALEADIAPRWRTMIGKVCGREPNEHGCRVTVRKDPEAAADAAGYLTKGAWSIGCEVEGTHSKEAKRGRFTPLDIVRRYADALEEGDQRAQDEWGALFRRYVEAYRGKRQTVWSPGLKAEFGVRDLDEETAAEGEGEPEVETVAVLGPRAWAAVREHHAEGALLRIAEQEGHEGVRALVARFGWDVGLEHPPRLEALGPEPPVMDYGIPVPGGEG